MQKALYLLTLATLFLSLIDPASGLGASPAAKLSVTKTPFGVTRAGEPVELYTLDNGRGLRAQVMTYGAIIYSLEAPDKNGKPTNVTINRETVTDYEKKSACFGALLGRYANRIGLGRITLEGQQFSLPLNNGKNHIHGGPRGFDKRVWKAEAVEKPDAVGVKLNYFSKDGEEGYPGNLDVTVLYTLNTRNE